MIPLFVRKTYILFHRNFGETFKKISVRMRLAKKKTIEAITEVLLVDETDSRVSLKALSLKNDSFESLTSTVMST